jgi:hypothetical protein
MKVSVSVGRTAQLRRRCGLAFAMLAAGASVLSSAIDLRAEPQVNAGLDLGVAGRGIDGEVWDETAFWLAARGDVLFAREGDADFGVGPYLEVGTLAFDELDVGAGGSLLVPVIEGFPIVLSVGPYLRLADDGTGLGPGGQVSAFWGTRSYDTHGTYEMAGGLMVALRRGFGDAEDTAIILGAHVDAAVLSLPFVWMGEALGGPSDEAAPIEPVGGASPSASAGRTRPARD